jgi:ABC-2 type transport system permease protein
MVQFIPLIMIPQMFLCGLLWPISSMPDYLQWIADFLPLTYGIEGMRGLMVQGQSLLDVIKDVGILAAYAAVLMVLAAFSTKRG